MKHVDMTSHGKIIFADVIRVRILKWVNYPVLLGWALNDITSVLIGEKQDI